MKNKKESATMENVVGALKKKAGGRTATQGFVESCKNVRICVLPGAAARGGRPKPKRRPVPHIRSWHIRRRNAWLAAWFGARGGVSLLQCFEGAGGGDATAGNGKGQVAHKRGGEEWVREPLTARPWRAQPRAGKEARGRVRPARRGVGACSTSTR